MNLGSRHAKPWTWWAWTPTTSMMSVLNGFVIRNGKWDYYTELWLPGETYIKSDGIFLYAICVYEDYFFNNEKN